MLLPAATLCPLPIADILGKRLSPAILIVASAAITCARHAFRRSHRSSALPQKSNLSVSISRGLICRRARMIRADFGIGVIAGYRRPRAGSTPI